MQTIIKWEEAQRLPVSQPCSPGLAGSPARPHPLRKSAFALQASVHAGPWSLCHRPPFLQKRLVSCRGAFGSTSLPLKVSDLKFLPSVALKRTVPVKTPVRRCRQIDPLIQTLLLVFVP